MGDTMFRLYTFLIILLITSSSFAINQVRVFVPEDSLHGVQELRAGHPGEIFIEISNDITIRNASVKIAATNFSTGETLWDRVLSNKYQFLLSPLMLPNRSFVITQQDNIWPDTIKFSFSATNIDNYAPQGNYSLTKFTVTPHTTGTMQFIPIEVTYRDKNYNLVTPQFISASIQVISDYDCNNNGIEDYLDIQNETSIDCDENGIPDECENLPDCNNNGLADACEGLPDCNENGIPDECELANNPSLDCNNNGILDECDFDCNFNGIPDDCETFTDCNCNGIPDNEDIASGYAEDSNGNGIPDNCDQMPEHYYRVIVPPNEYHGSQEMLVGFEEEIYILAHTDYDLGAAVVYADFSWSSGVELWSYIEGVHLLPPEVFDLIKVVNYFNETTNSPDTLEGAGLKIMTGYQSPGDFQFIRLKVIPTDTGTVTVSNSTSRYGDSSFFQNNSGLLYVPLLADDIVISYFPDCNNNGILDSIDIVNGILNDCNNNFIADHCEVNDHPESDCDNNNLVDECELENNPSLDCNNNGTIDICDIDINPSLDCDQNGKLDLCEINDDPSLDCNNNFVLDVCDIVNNPELDCNGNGILDFCDILHGTSNDCNFNQLPDECDFDCNLNGIPDDCEAFTDCNCNALDDAIDITSGWSNDTDNNLIPDECEGKAGTYIRIYARGSDGTPSNELPVNIPSDIIFALTSVSGVDGLTIPISPFSNDNSRLWDYLTDDNIEYLPKDDIEYLGISSFAKQFPQWPDSLLLSITTLITSEPFPQNNTMPIIRLKVTPTREGELNWQPIHLSPSNNFSYVNTNDKIVYPLTLWSEMISIGCCRVIRGNIDYDINNTIDIADLIYLVNYQFGSPNGPTPYCFKEADVDNSGSVDIADLVYLVSYQFQNGSPPHSCQE